MATIGTTQMTNHAIPDAALSSVSPERKDARAPVDAADAASATRLAAARRCAQLGNELKRIEIAPSSDSTAQLMTLQSAHGQHFLTLPAA